MKGFFGSNHQFVKPKHKGDSGCIACGLYRTCNSPKMPVTGKGRFPVLFVAEAPGKMEDVRNEQLIGESGQLLRGYLFGIGVDLDMCRKTNACCCRPPDNRTPTKDQVAHCRRYLAAELTDNQPEVVVLLGGTAVESYWGERYPGLDTPIGAWSGYQTPDWTNNCWVCPTYHPSYVLRQTQDSAAGLLLKRDLEQAFECVGKPVPNYSFVEDSICVLSEKEAEAKLAAVMTYPATTCVSFDYETTGLKPDAPGHDILCMSFSYRDREGELKTYAFMMTKGLTESVVAFLTSPLRKNAANKTFEERWSREIVGVPVNNWYWDVCLGQHVLDNRTGTSGVKFQSHALLGIRDYHSHLDRYKKSSDGKGNSFNTMHKAPEQDLLWYCGMDSAIEHVLYEQQVVRFGYDLNDLED